MEPTTVLLVFELQTTPGWEVETLLRRVGDHPPRAGATTSRLYRITNAPGRRYGLATEWYSEALYRQWREDFLAGFSGLLSVERTHEMHPIGTKEPPQR